MRIPRRVHQLVVNAQGLLNGAWREPNLYFSNPATGTSTAASKWNHLQVARGHNRDSIWGVPHTRAKANGLTCVPSSMALFTWVLVADPQLRLVQESVALTKWYSRSTASFSGNLLSLPSILIGHFRSVPQSQGTTSPLKVPNRTAARVTDVCPVRWVLFLFKYHFTPYRWTIRTWCSRRYPPTGRPASGKSGPELAWPCGTRTWCGYASLWRPEGSLAPALSWDRGHQEDCFLR